jgi:hypothetical protein
MLYSTLILAIVVLIYEIRERIVSDGHKNILYETKRNADKLLTAVQHNGNSLKFKVR